MTRPACIAFLGPSLPADEARRLLRDVDVRGPARQGDVFEALRARPHVIALIDGVFESQPSVWHQELRAALADGVHVLGASSMGALRAVELAPFGMVGVGEVFEAYAAGRFVDDADVALLHADAEHGYRPLTVPLVNVVAQAEHAIDLGLLRDEEAIALVEAARSIHYKDRHWPDVIDATGWEPARRKAFLDSVRAGPCDVKADDARACLAAAGRLLREPRRPADAAIHFSVWARRAWLHHQEPPDPSGIDARDGLRTLLLAALARDAGLRADPALVARFDHDDAPLPPALRRRYAEALALEAMLLDRPGLLLADAPDGTEGRFTDDLRQRARRPGKRR